MSRLSALWFRYVQGAHFYQALHQQAVALLPPGQGQAWLDVGCGPGLVTRLAHQHGYRATGLDLDAAMIWQARRQSSPPDGPSYVQAGLDDMVLRAATADVVSAASLLMVVPDRGAALRQLLQALAPGGTLLVIETTRLMAQAAIRGLPAPLCTGRRAWVLRLWARVRSGAQPVDVDTLCPDGYEVQHHDLLGGLVRASLVRAETARSSEAP